MKKYAITYTYDDLKGYHKVDVCCFFTEKNIVDVYNQTINYFSIKFKQENNAEIISVVKM
jgi:hypothetical protein